MNKKFGGGVINELSHEIYYLMFMVGNLTLNKTVKLRNLDGSDVESEALVQMQEKKRKIYCNLYLNYNSTYEDRKCEIFFRTKKIIADFNTNIISIFNRNKILKIKVFEKRNEIYQKQILDIFSIIKHKKNIIQNHNQFKFYNKINKLLKQTNK